MKTPTILLVTDDPHTASAASSTASQLHHVIFHIDSGPAALSALMDDCKDFDFAVIDLDRHSGNQTLFKTAAGLMPVIGVTGQNHASAGKMASHCHAVCHLEKPLQVDAARVAFARALHHQRPE